MIHKKLRDLYYVDTISQDKGWEKVLNALEQYGDQEIEIDFTGINVVEPWTLSSFQMLIKKPNVHLKFTNAEDIVTKIRMMYIIDGLNVDNVVNVVVEVPKEKTAEEKRNELHGKALIDFFKEQKVVNTDGIEETVSVFNAAEKYSQMHSTNTLGYIDYAIKKIHEDTGISRFIINLDGVEALNNVLENLASMIVEYKKEGIILDLDITNEENYKAMGLFLHKLSGTDFDEGVKFELLEQFMKEHANAPGLLIKYKKSRALDDFGRQGGGTPVMCRIAIFKALRGSGKTGSAVFETYNKDYFYTRQHWLISHDNNELNRLVTNQIEVSMEELGFLNEFLGTKYHFIEPIQMNARESVKVIIDIDDEGYNVSKLCTIPERMKYVFDDWGIKYDKKYLDGVIKKTKEHLDKIKDDNPDDTLKAEIMEELMGE